MTKTGRTRMARAAILGVLCLLSAVATWDTLQHPDGITVTLLRATHVLWDKPRIFGPFHLVMLSLCVLLAVVLLFLRDRIPASRLDDVVFGAGLILLVMEVYKQLYWWAILGNGSYNFGILPLQFCSYALYLFLLVPLLPEGRVKNVLYAFCALYQTMGGWIVMAYPTLYAEMALSFHTMLWHTVMIGTGLLILCKRGYGAHYLREMLPTTALFLGTMVVATVCNLMLTPYTGQSPQPLNLFYMSPYETNNYVVIADVRRAFGWMPALVCYAALFIGIGATLMWLVGRLVVAWDRKRGK